MPRKSLETRQPSAADLVPDPPVDLDTATAMMLAAVGDFKRAALRQAILVSHAREVLFRGEPGPWLSWCIDTCELSKRFAVTLWHAGDLLRKVRYTALLGCSAEKLELLAALDDGKLARFLAAHDPREMTREQVRDAIQNFQTPGTAAERPDAGRKSQKDASPVAKHHRAIHTLSGVPDEDRALIAAEGSPAACLAAGLCCLDIAIAILRDERCWDAARLKRWIPELRSAVEIYEGLITRAEA